MQHRNWPEAVSQTPLFDRRIYANEEHLAGELTVTSGLGTGQEEHLETSYSMNEGISMTVLLDNRLISSERCGVLTTQLLSSCCSCVNIDTLR